jgi:hypothetical protein
MQLRQVWRYRSSSNIMQHTLVTPVARKQLRREYHVRAWIVTLFVLSVAGIVGVASLLPAFLRGSLEERVQLNAIASLEKNKQDSGVVHIEQELIADKLLLAVLAEGSDRMLMSAEIQDLITIKGSVHLTSFAIERRNDGSVRIVVQGIAPTRESLLAFKTKVETTVPGTATNLPISQLAKSTNIQFSMEIIRPKS